jgi:hypothetical protein
MLQASGYNDEDLSRKLFHSDERAYLLEEIERKDNMLSMLTEGLREVRTYMCTVICVLCVCVYMYMHTICLMRD